MKHPKNGAEKQDNDAEVLFEDEEEKLQSVVSTTVASDEITFLILLSVNKNTKENSRH